MENFIPIYALIPCTVSFTCSISRRYDARAMYVFPYFLYRSSSVPKPGFIKALKYLLGVQHICKYFAELEPY